MKKRKTQSLIFDKKHFKNRFKVRSWLSDNGYKPLKYKKQPIENGEDNTFKVTIREPYRFKKSTLRKETKDKGVKCLKGILK